MPPRRKIELPDHVRRAVLADVALSHERAVVADEEDKIRIFLATEQGLDTYEIATRLGVSQSVVSKWSRLGREAYERREKEKEAREQGGSQADSDPVRPGEPEPVG